MFQAVSMEMESVPQDHDGNSNKESLLEQLSPPGSPDISDVFGDPQVNSRLGDEYQVEIPPMITESEHLQLLKNPVDSEVIVDVSHSFLMGLPVPIMWIHDEVTNIEDELLGFVSNPDDAANANRSVKSRKRKKNHVHAKKKGSIHNVEPLIVGLELDSGEESKPASLGNKGAEKTNLDRPCKRRSYHPVPGSLGDPWVDAEADAFLLGLYLFGKKFVQVKRFIEKKEMGDILSFYYGEFYRSDKYRRWSDCRKTRSRKCTYGRKIFTGWRLQELLSRLHPHVPEELQNTLLEVSMSFEEGRTSLEQYVSSLKEIVGIHVLVEAVGIGKGKEDLTGLAMEPVKTNQMFPVCPIMPTGKACSSLTSSDIVKFLTGGLRLSKARCNDIFWEAVWPRLLARGWHSEQPRNQGYVSSNHHLVFLVPGVKKFSRRKLVKGDHYFDSVSDILSKVASEPNLLELEADEIKDSSCNEKDGSVPEVPSDQDDPSNHQPHRYLKPRVSTCTPNSMKFTIVDSSSAHGGKSSKVRKLRYLPADYKTATKLTCVSRENEGFFSKNSPDEYEQDAANMLLDGEKNSDNADHSDGTFVSGSPDQMRFTVVDTSLAHGRKSSEVRELRYAPNEYKVTSKMTHLSIEFEGHSHEDSVDKHDQNAADTPLNDEPNAADVPPNDEPDAADVPLNEEQDAADMLLNARKNVNNPCDCGSNQKALDSNTTNKLVESHQDRKTSTSDDNLSKRIIKHQFSRRAKSGHSNNLVPLMKRRRLTACAKAEANRVTENFSVGLESKQVGACCDFSSTDGGNKAISQEKVSLTSSSAKGSPEEERSEGIFSGDCFGMDMSQGRTESHQSQSIIDLNLPQVPQESANGEPSLMEVEDSQGINSNGSCFPSNRNRVDPGALRTSVDVGAAEQQPSMNPRRQSTRNRPLTTKALEALESGFLNFQKRPKNKEVHTQEIPFSSPSRKARSRVKITSNRGGAGTGIMNPNEAKGLNEAFFVSKGKVSKPLDRIEKNWLTIY